MGRIFTKGRIYDVQEHKLKEFRRRHARKLKKGDVIRVHQQTPNVLDQGEIRAQLDLRPQTKDVLYSRKYGNRLIKTANLTVIEIGVRFNRNDSAYAGGSVPAVGDFSSGFSTGFTSI